MVVEAKYSTAQLLAWAAELLQLSIHTLEQLQSGAVYLLMLDAFHEGLVPLNKVHLSAQHEYDFVENYRTLRAALERLSIVKFLDRRQLLTSPAAHGPFLLWLHSRCEGLATRRGYDPVEQRRLTKGGDLHAIPMPVAPSKLSTPRADIGGRATKPKVLSTKKEGKGSSGPVVPQLDLHASAASCHQQSMPRGVEAADKPKSRLMAFTHKVLSQAATLKTPRGGRSGSCTPRMQQPAGSEPAAAAAGAPKPGLNPASLPGQTTPRLFGRKGRQEAPKQAPVLASHPLSLPPQTPQDGGSQSKAGFSHGSIPASSLKRSGDSAANAGMVPKLRMPGGTENEASRANPSVPTPRLAWGRNPLPKATPRGSRLQTPRAAALAEPTAASEHIKFSRVQAVQPTDDSMASRVADLRSADEPPPLLRGAAMDEAKAAAISPAVGEYANLQTPDAWQGKPLRQAHLRSSVGPDSASSMAGAQQGGRAAAAVARRKAHGGVTVPGGLLSPDKIDALDAGADKVEEADRVARGATKAVVQAISELETALADIGSTHRDGYLCRGKLRCRRWMVAATIPRTRELLAHVRQLSLLAGAGTAARARARRAKRLLKELSAAELAFADVCDRIAKAERFFPVAGVGQAEQDPGAQGDGQQGARLLEVSLRAVGEAMAALQQLWLQVAPHSQWASNAKQTRDAISALQLNRRRSGARAPAARHAPSNSEAETLSDGSGWSDSEEAPASTGLASPQRSLEAPGASEEAASPAVGPLQDTPGSADTAEEQPEHAAGASAAAPAGSEAATTHDKLEVTVLETAHAPLAASEPATPDLGSVFTSAEAPGQEAAQGKDSCKHEESAAEAEGALTPDAARAAAAAEAARQLLGSRLARVRKTGRTLPSDMKAPRGRQVNAELASFFGVGTQQQAGQDSASPAKPAAKEEPLEDGREAPKQIALPGGNTYAGNVCGGAPNGVGVFKFGGGRGRYEGEFVGGAFEGFGAETFEQGMYVGTFRAGLRDGTGVCHFRNGDFYEGGWRGGTRHGRGMQQCTDGSNYVGGYRKGVRSGAGIYVFPNGDRYEGECARDLPAGAGVYRFAASGATAEGAWAAGRCHGWCLLTVGSRQSYGRWDRGEVVQLSRLQLPAPGRAKTGASKDDDEEDELSSAEAEALDMATEAARTARAAAARAIAAADEHWHAAGRMQMTLQSTLQRAQSAAKAARRKAAPFTV